MASLSLSLWLESFKYLPWTGKESDLRTTKETVIIFIYLQNCSITLRKLKGLTYNLQSHEIYTIPLSSNQCKRWTLGPIPTHSPLLNSATQTNSTRMHIHTSAYIIYMHICVHTEISSFLFSQSQVKSSLIASGWNDYTQVSRSHRHQKKSAKTLFSPTLRKRCSEVQKERHWSPKNSGPNQPNYKLNCS